MSVFNEDSIKTAIAKELSTNINIPDNHRAAMVAYIDNDKAQIALASKINDRWRVELIGEHEWIGDNKVGAIVTGSW